MSSNRDRELKRLGNHNFSFSVILKCTEGVRMQLLIFYSRGHSSFSLWRLWHEQYKRHTCKEEPSEHCFIFFNVMRICQFSPLSYSSLLAQLHPVLLFLQVTVQVIYLLFSGNQLPQSFAWEKVLHGTFVSF